jgi:hypothetical protein
MNQPTHPTQIDGSHRDETPAQQEQRIRALFRSDKGMSREDMERFGERVKEARPKTIEEVMGLLNQTMDEV